MSRNEVIRQVDVDEILREYEAVKIARQELQNKRLKEKSAKSKRRASHGGILSFFRGWFSHGKTEEGEKKLIQTDVSLAQLGSAIELSAFLEYLSANSPHAVDMFNDLIKRNPNTSNTILIKLPDSTIKKRPTNADLHYYLGKAYLSRGDYTKAIENLETAVRLSPMPAAVWGELGDLYRLTSRREKALKAYRKAVGLEPNNKELRSLELMMGGVVDKYSFKGFPQPEAGTVAGERPLSRLIEAEKALSEKGPEPAANGKEDARAGNGPYKRILKWGSIAVSATAIIAAAAYFAIRETGNGTIDTVAGSTVPAVADQVQIEQPNVQPQDEQPMTQPAQSYPQPSEPPVTYSPASEKPEQQSAPAPQTEAKTESTEPARPKKPQLEYVFTIKRRGEGCPSNIFIQNYKLLTVDLPKLYNEKSFIEVFDLEGNYISKHFKDASTVKDMLDYRATPLPWNRQFHNNNEYINPITDVQDHNGRTIFSVGGNSVAGHKDYVYVLESTLSYQQIEIYDINGNRVLDFKGGPERFRNLLDMQIFQDRLYVADYHRCAVDVFWIID